MKTARKIILAAMICLLPSLAVHADSQQSVNEPSLALAFADAFLVGAALSREQIMGEEPEVLKLVKAQFNALTAENDMKWERIQPLEGQFDWEAPDALAAFADAHDMYVTGHVLLWHEQTPDWVFLDSAGNPASRELLVDRLEKHISTVVGRYRGKVQSWDVLNEVLNEDGSLRESPWLKIIGKDYLEKAFEFAHAADPEAQLYYNDYNLFKPEKREGAVRLVQYLQGQGVPVHGIGMQAHYGLDNPQDISQFEDSIIAFSQLGVPVMLTELDVSVLPFPEQAQWGADISMNLELSARFNPYADGLPAEVERAQTDQYLDLFRILWNHRDSVSRVTFWGVNDGHSWKNGWPMAGRTDYPLFFDRNNQPKPVFHEIITLTGKP